MELSTQTIMTRGRRVEVPCLRGDRATLISSGRWLRVASIFDEEWLPEEAIGNPEQLLAILQESRLKADLFTFSQGVTDPTPWFDYATEWDNSAVVAVSTFKDWWESLPQESRKNVRRGEKRGVVARTSPFDDALVAGIKQIYDETPVRQGRAFWHYGKSLDEVKRANASYLERSEFVTAYLGDELIGFIKMVFVGKVARIMQILSKNAHADKRPPEHSPDEGGGGVRPARHDPFCVRPVHLRQQRAHPDHGVQASQWLRGDRTPRYYVPLTLKGRLALALNLHRGVKNLVPGRVTHALLDLRAKFYARRDRSASASSEEAQGDRQGQHA
jgi:hypothetical protein